jgi:hypothetical protein
MWQLAAATAPDCFGSTFLLQLRACLLDARFKTAAESCRRAHKAAQASATGTNHAAADDAWRAKAYLSIKTCTYGTGAAALAAAAQHQYNTCSALSMQIQ